MVRLTQDWKAMKDKGHLDATFGSAILPPIAARLVIYCKFHR